MSDLFPQLGQMKLADGQTPSQLVTVAGFHNQDNQALPVGGNALLTAGVAQLLNISGNADRQRETGSDNLPATGIAATGSNFAMQFLTTDSTDNKAASVTTTVNAQVTLPAPIITVASTSGLSASGSVLIGGLPVSYTGISGNNLTGCTGGYGITPVGSSVAQIQSFTPALMSGTLQGVAWTIKVGSLLTLDSGGTQETVLVVATTASTFSCVTAQAHNGTGTAFPITGFSFNQERDASGELDAASGSGTAVAVAYEYNGGHLSGNYDRERNVQGKGIATGTVSTATQGASTLTMSATPTGLVAGNAMYLTGGTVEVVYVAKNYTGGTTVPLQSPIQQTGHTGAQWDIFAINGPGASEFTPNGVGIDAIALTDTVNNLHSQLQQAKNSVGAASVRTGGISTAFNLSAATVVKATPGRTVRVSVITAGSTAGTVNDCTTTGAAAVGNQVAAIPNTVGVYQLDWPHAAGIVVVPGTSQVLAVNYD